MEIKIMTRIRMQIRRKLRVLEQRACRFLEHALALAVADDIVLLSGYGLSCFSVYFHE